MNQSTSDYGERIDGVVVRQIDPLTFTVWNNTGEPDLRGFGITSYPVGAGRGSGFPYTDPDASQLTEDMSYWEPQFRFETGETWTICVEPIAAELDRDGTYHFIAKRRGCSAPFVWH